MKRRCKVYLAVMLVGKCFIAVCIRASPRAMLASALIALSKRCAGATVESMRRACCVDMEMSGYQADRMEPRHGRDIGSVTSLARRNLT